MADVIVSFCENYTYEDLRSQLEAEGFVTEKVLRHVGCAFGSGGDLERIRHIEGVYAVELDRDVQVLDPAEE